MSTISLLSRPMREWLMAFCMFAMVLLAAGCGGESGATDSTLPAPGNNSPNPPPVVQTVTGVATPTSVAVVTATNAQ